MKKIKLSDSLINVTKLSSGTVMGQIIAILTLPFITRLYGAEVIGIWTVVTAFSNIVMQYTDLGLSNSMMMCDDDKILRRYSIVTKLSLLLSIASGLVITLYYIIIQSEISYALTIGIFTILYTYELRQIVNCCTLLTREKQYNVLMKNATIRFGSIAVVSIGLGYLGKYTGWTVCLSYGYFIGNIVGQELTLFHLRRHLPKTERHIKLEEYKKTIKENKDYVRYQMPASIMIILRTELPNLLISSLFGNTILGYFSISQKLLTIPATFLGQPLGTVFYQKAAEMRRKGLEIGDFVKRNVNRGMLIALVPMTLFAAYGDVAINIFFGMEYSVGSIICRIIVYRTLFNFISMSTRGLDIVLNKQQYALYCCCAQTVFAAVSVICGFYMFHDIFITSLLIVVTFIIVQIIYFVIMYRVMKINPLTYVRNMLLIIAAMFIISELLRFGTLFILGAFPNGFFNYLLGMFSQTVI